MQPFHSILSLTSILASSVAAFDFVDFNDAKITVDDGPVKGMALNPGDVGMPTALMAIGYGRVRARGAIAKGAKLTTAAAGGVKTAAAGAVNVFAQALTAAADGEFVDIIIR
jgi:hypothetical protein